MIFYCVSGSEQKLQVCKEYGADVAINYKTQDFAVEVLSATADIGTILSLNLTKEESVDSIVASYYAREIAL